MEFDALQYQYPSKRNVIYGRRGMVATSQPLAAQAGLDILKKGGNAIDAAIATAACLTVVEPTSNGIGSDAFAIVWSKGEIHGLNSSGPAPKSISIDILKATGICTMPKYGWTPVTVPGAPGAWAELSERFGRLPLIEALKPAIEYASYGYPVSPGVSPTWNRAYKIYKENLMEEDFQNWSEIFAPKSRAPQVGEMWSSKGHAETLASIGKTMAKSFYSGEIAQKIDFYSKKSGGFLRLEDLEAFKPEWVTPIRVNYRGYDVWEIPPNGQGLVALIAFNILKGFNFSVKDSSDTYHKQIEAIKLAFADGHKYITDPSYMKLNVKHLLSEEYAAERRSLITKEALIPGAGEPPKGGTVYLATADDEGNMVSYIQSNYMGFGSGIVIPDTGISLQNRGHNFSLDPSHDNCLMPGKRTYHTIIPGFLSKDNKPIGPFGVMGGFMQPQGHLQVVMNAIDFNMNPQEALDAPRFQWMKDKLVEVEHSFPQHIAQALVRKGHVIKYTVDSSSFGRGQIIWRNDNGVLCGGTEPRTDGTIAVW
ncbi:MAG TPA: gamma-glutamyltransferase family protein [Clostridiaceae bacterium]